MKYTLTFVLLLTLISCSSSGGNETQAPTYRLTTRFTGPDAILGIERDLNNAPVPILVNRDSSELTRWALIPSQTENASSPLYTIRSSQDGEELFLTVSQIGEEVQVGLSSDGSTDLSLWSITPRDNGYCQLSSFSFGEGLALDIVNDDEDRFLQLATSGDFSGQNWQFEIVDGQANDQALGSCLTEDAGNTDGFTRTELYRRTEYAGFSVLVNPDVDALGQLGEDTLRELEIQLNALEPVVSAQTLDQLRQVPIWVEANQVPNSSGQYHLSAQWLMLNGYNPDKAGAVEISNARVFLQDASELSVSTVLHELSHARQHFLIDNNESLIDFEGAYEQAVASGSYESVAYATGTTRRAYALTNHQEYFAELSEAYLGRNDFYPFNASELQDFDPVGYDMVRLSW